MTPTWRSSIVGVIVLLLVVARVVFKHDSIFDPETIALLGAAGGLIAGTDKLLGR